MKEMLLHFARLDPLSISCTLVNGKNMEVIFNIVTSGLAAGSVFIAEVETAEDLTKKLTQWMPAPWAMEN
jgi:hypothetical protein